MVFYRAHWAMSQSQFLLVPLWQAMSDTLSQTRNGREERENNQDKIRIETGMEWNLLHQSQSSEQHTLGLQEAHQTVNIN